ERARHVERLLGADDGRGSEDRARRTAGGASAGRGARGTGRHRRRHDNPLKIVAEFVTSAVAAADLPRDGAAEVALVGRSNVGKSSLINALVRQRVARTSATPGKTRLANVYRVTRGGGAPFHLLDLPGYGYARAPKGIRSAAGPEAARRTSQDEFEAIVRAVFARGP